MKQITGWNEVFVQTLLKWKPTAIDSSSSAFRTRQNAHISLALQPQLTGKNVPGTHPMHMQDKVINPAIWHKYRSVLETRVWSFVESRIRAYLVTGERATTSRSTPYSLSWDGQKRGWLVKNLSHSCRKIGCRVESQQYQQLSYKLESLWRRRVKNIVPLSTAPHDSLYGLILFAKSILRGQ